MQKWKLPCRLILRRYQATPRVQHPSKSLLLVQPRHTAQGLLQEGLRLAETYSQQHCPVLLLGRAKTFTPTPGWYFRSGIVERLQQETNKGQEIFINGILTAIQLRNLEQSLGCRVFDRIGIIVEIFAQRAHTKEAKLQVQLALLQLSKTRLVRVVDSKGLRTTFGIEGSAQVVSARDRARGSGRVGGLGGGSQGEKEISLQRHRVSQRERSLRLQIEEVRRTRNLQRQGRRRNKIPVIAIVGYTNAGKSSLVNTLTKSDLECDDLFFKTLDPISRRLRFHNGQVCILSDTVGFISDLPVCLLAAFHATLEEATHADIILHVIDADANNFQKQRIEVYKTLQEIGVDQDILKNRTIEVYNKIDRLKDWKKDPYLVVMSSSNGRQLLVSSFHRLLNFRVIINRFKDEEGGFHPKRVSVSALNGEGISQLMQTLHKVVKQV